MRVVAKKVFELAPVIAGRSLLNVTVGPDHRPFLLSVEQPLDDQRETKGGVFPKNQSSHVNRFCVRELSSGASTVIESRENAHFVQPLPEGKWLLVRPRADDEADHNAGVHGPDGVLLHSFHAGDGIADVQATSEGRIWISYFDEGVFGDPGLGGNGLVCLNVEGWPTFRFSDLSADLVVRSMADCSALNVCSGKEAWLYYYTDFPLVQLIEDRIAGYWRMPVAGSHGFAVAGGKVLLGGSYDKKESLFLVHLSHLEVQPAAKAGDGTPLLLRVRLSLRRRGLGSAVPLTMRASGVLVG